jgi:23S rRNA (cytidine1920-2'-O)/16S rRNA (cytidine1409-2'-O)-methyltransferase
MTATRTVYGLWKSCAASSSRHSPKGTVTKPARLDAELVRRHLAVSRTEAKRAIEDGLVSVNGMKAQKASTLVRPDAVVELAGAPRRFVSRGGEKLDGALTFFEGVVVRDRRWLDAGSSTGGFTDCLLTRGAAAVLAVDVGYGQLDWRLRNDPRVVVRERANIRDLGPDDLPWRPDGVVADLSFISLAIALPGMARLARADADHVLLVKPQFEVGRGAVGKGGVVRDPIGWRSAIDRVVAAASKEGLGLVDACSSPLTGPAGNREFFVHLRRGEDSNLTAVEIAVDNAIKCRQ